MIESQFCIDRELLLTKARRMTRSIEDAEDLVQELAIKLHTLSNAVEFHGKGAMRSYMQRLLVNLAIDESRKKNRRLEVRGLPENILANKANSDQFSTTEDQIINKMKIELLYSAIDSLNDLERMVVLTQLEYGSYRNVASITGLTESQVRNILHSARQTLRSAEGF